jgi:ATP-binding cassette subfamily B protein
MQIPHNPFSFIYYFSKKQKLKFFLIVLAFLIWSANDAVFPYLLKNIVNIVQHYRGDVSGLFSAVRYPFIGVILLWFLSETAMRGQGVLQIYTIPQFRVHIREQVFYYVKQHSHEYFSNQFAGNLAKKLADLPNSCQMIIEIVCFQFITVIAGAIIVLTMMWLTSPIFFSILLVWLLIHLGIMLIFLKPSHRLAEMHSEAVSVLSGKVVDVFSNILNVRIFARNRYEADYFRSYQQAELEYAKKALWSIEKMRFGLGINGLFLIFAMLFSLLYGYAHHWVSLGDFTQIMMQSFWLLGWLWFLSFQLKNLIREVGTVKNGLRLIRKQHDLQDKPNAINAQFKQGKISFNNVDFAYIPKQPVFKNLSLTIKAGEKIGLVGFSGSGKSTFVNLLLRFYDIQSGSITIDNYNIAEITQESLRSQIAMIPQDPSLFHRSLMENIRYGRLNASDAEVIETAKLAHCHEFIEQLDEGYQSLVGERGIKLSGGQRQRIAIARAMLKHAPILILDEATSALDSVTEKIIQSSLKELMRDKTTLVIAHRLSTLSDMDRIIVFHQGKIIEDGPIDELLAAKQHFAKLWSMQVDGFLPEEAI